MISKHFQKAIRMFAVAAFLLVSVVGTAFAQTVDTNDNDSLGKQEFEVELTSGNQSPITESVPVEFKLKSTIDSKTAFIRWKASHDIDFGGREEIKFALEKDREYTFTQSVKAQKSGVYRITVEVEAWRAEANYVDSAQVNLRFNEDLELEPGSESYKNGKVLWVIGRIVIGLVLLVILFFAGKFGFKKFKSWLAKD